VDEKEQTKQRVSEWDLKNWGENGGRLGR